MQLGPVREYVPGDATHLDTRGSSAMAAGPANDRPIQPETLHTHVQLALESATGIVIQGDAYSELLFECPGGFLDGQSYASGAINDQVIRVGFVAREFLP